MPALNLIPAASVSFVGHNFSISDSHSYTFSNQSLGAAASDRLTILAILDESGSEDEFWPATVTIGGIALTEAVRQGGWQGASAAALFYGRISGASADIVIHCQQIFDHARRLAIDVYRLTGQVSDAPYDTVGGSGTDFAIDVPEDGIVVGAAYFNNSLGAVTWTGLTRNSDADLESIDHTSTASKNFGAEQIGAAIQLSKAATRFAAASWR